MNRHSTNEQPYVLGTGLDEHARLGLQHRLWADAACDAWKRAGIGPGSRVLDIGCGPGHAALDLAQLVGPAGAVVGVDESSEFVGALNEQARARGLAWVRGAVHDVQQLPIFGEHGFDAAYARWVLCFVPDPGSVVRGVSASLRPGATFVIHDYFNYTTMTTAPRQTWHDVLVRATAESWRARGGDPDVTARLPALLHEHGFDLLDLRVHQRIARGGGGGGRDSAHRSVDPMLHWPLTWWRTFAPKLKDMGLITHEQLDEAMAGLAQIERDEHAFFVCPPVFEVIARKQ